VCFGMSHPVLAPNDAATRGFVSQKHGGMSM
jgi:hypothetical protein